MSSPVRDLLRRFVLALAAAFVLAPLVGLLAPQAPFHRVMTRTFLGLVVLSFSLRRGSPRSWPEKLRALGLRGPGRLARLALGFGTAVVLLGLLLWISYGLGGRDLRPAQPRTSLAFQLAKGLLSGFLVAYLEELLFRGYFRAVLGGLASALLYAAAHFFRPLHGSDPAGSGFDPLLAVKRLPDLLESWTDARIATMGFLSLFLLGLALNRLRARTGTLHAGIGLHAGLVFSVALYRRFFSERSPGNWWVFGGSRLHDGLLGVAMIGLLYLAVLLLPLPWVLRSRARSRTP